MKYLVILAALFLSACGGGQMASPHSQVVVTKHLNVVFIGDSLTYNWNLATSFPGENYINKGVSGDTSAMIRARFQNDAIAQNPDIIMLMAGTNDIENIALSATQDNIRAMIDAAKAANIRIVVATIPPKSRDLAWQNPDIIAYNAWLRTLSVPVADYYPLLVDANGELRAEYALPDPLTPICCIHINTAGYGAIDPIATGHIN